MSSPLPFFTAFFLLSENVTVGQSSKLFGQKELYGSGQNSNKLGQKSNCQDKMGRNQDYKRERELEK